MRDDDGRENGNAAEFLSTMQERAGNCQSGLVQERNAGTLTEGSVDQTWQPGAKGRVAFGDRRVRRSFWDRVDQTAPHGCWLWTAYRNAGGYARFHKKGRPVLAHRLCWESLFGPVPDGLILRHSCDVRHCVNPAHLQLGTHLDNAQDCSRRGRAAGTGRGVNRLNADLVRLIRRRAAEGVKRIAIAKEVGVSPRNVWYVLSGKTWAHVDTEPERAAAGGAP